MYYIQFEEKNIRQSTLKCDELRKVNFVDKKAINLR